MALINTWVWTSGTITDISIFLRFEDYPVEGNYVENAVWNDVKSNGDLNDGSNNFEGQDSVILNGKELDILEIGRFGGTVKLKDGTELDHGGTLNYMMMARLEDDTLIIRLNDRWQDELEDAGIGPGDIKFVYPDQSIEQNADPDIDHIDNDSFVCFAKGTSIATPGNDISVEDLEIGDLVLNQNGEAVEVKWVGIQTVLTAFPPCRTSDPGAYRSRRTRSGSSARHAHGNCRSRHVGRRCAVATPPLFSMARQSRACRSKRWAKAIRCIMSKPSGMKSSLQTVHRRKPLSTTSRARFSTTTPSSKALYGADVDLEELPYARAMSARQVPDRIKRGFENQDAA